MGTWEEMERTPIILCKCQVALDIGYFSKVARLQRAAVMKKPCQAHSIGLQSIYIILLGFERIKDCFFCFLVIWWSLALKTPNVPLLEGRMLETVGCPMAAPSSAAGPVPAVSARCPERPAELPRIYLVCSAITTHKGISPFFHAKRWKGNQEFLKIKDKQHWKSPIINRTRGRTGKCWNIWKNTIFLNILLKKVHRSVFWLQELSSSQTPIKYEKS